MRTFRFHVIAAGDPEKYFIQRVQITCFCLRRVQVKTQAKVEARERWEEAGLGASMTPTTHRNAEHNSHAFDTYVANLGLDDALMR
jgi:hypothetical protein